MTFTNSNLLALVLSFTSLVSTPLFAGATPEEIVDWYQQRVMQQ
jgi:hypothetical protein